MKQSRAKYSKEISKLVKFEGSSKLRNQDHYSINGTLLIHNKDLFNEIIRCSCRWHSIKDIDNKKDCVYKLALKIYLKEKSKKEKN